jgi:hypothetical protein
MNDQLVRDGRRFTIRWDEMHGGGAYRVSTPNLQEAEVVVAAEYDAVYTELELLRQVAHLDQRGLLEHLLDTHKTVDELRARIERLEDAAQKAYHYIDTQFGPPGSNNLARPLLDKLRRAAPDRAGLPPRGA